MPSVSLDRLARLQPMASLGPQRLNEILAECQPHRFGRGSDPLRAANWTDQVLYLVHGQLKVDAHDGSSRVMVGGHERANAPLAYGESRHPASRAITDVELLSVGEGALDLMVTWSELVASADTGPANAEATDWRTMSGMLALTNLTQGAFAVLPPANIQLLLERFQRLPVERGEIIIRQGDVGDYYYLIESGRCKVSRQVGGASVHVAELKEGDAFGEEALVADMPRNATVSMKTDGVLLRLAKADFDTLLRAPLLQRLAPADAERQVAAGAIWIDVRYPAEYQADGYPGAINLPLSELRRAAAALDPARNYIVYCQTGRRSSAAAFLLSQRGLRASLLDGGMKAHTSTREFVA